MNDIQFNQELWKKLTPREIDILQAAADDLSCKMTAQKLGTTEKTVQVHRHNILKKLKLKNSASLVNFINTNATYI